MRLWIYLFLFAGLFACKSSKKASTQAAFPEDFELTIQKTGCHGRCPVYFLSVSANGEVLYQGDAFVDKLGRYKKVLTQETLFALVSELEQANFWEMEEEYNNPAVMDLPSVITTCTMNGRTKKVVNRFEAPEIVSALQEKLDHLIGDGDYLPAEKSEK
ncbi:MAG: DUF6438 domain-containing protein [Bacteroidia bacterium]